MKISERNYDDPQSVPPTIGFRSSQTMMPMVTHPHKEYERIWLCAVSLWQPTEYSLLRVMDMSVSRLSLPYAENRLPRVSIRVDYLINNTHVTLCLHSLQNHLPVNLAV